LDLEIVTLIT